MIYFNEIDPYAAAWLGNLWPAAALDTRSISDVKPTDLEGRIRAHFFAGIGGWEYALRLAGWPEGREVWTGSCPCQPFSDAGGRAGERDERHLWPEFRRLIAERRPATIFGEQVASSLGRGWLAGVRADLEALGYAVGAADLCAAGAGAPHIRQRLFWVADAGHAEWREGDFPRGLEGRDALRREGEEGPVEPGERGAAGGVANPDRDRAERAGAEEQVVDAGCAPRGWSNYEPVRCADGKTRRVEPGSFPLAHGIPNRVGRLRAYGNAIVPPLAATFIKAFLESGRVDE